MVAIFVFITFVLIISINLIVTKVREKRIPVFEEEAPVFDREVFTKESIYVPQGIYYSSGHTWLDVNEEGRLRLGMDDFLNKIIKPQKISYKVEEGKKVKKGEPILEVITNHTKLNIYSPIDGYVYSVNRKVIDNINQLKENPYKENWFLEIEPDDTKTALTNLRIGKEVIGWMKNEVNRFKDLLSHLSPKPSLVGATLYDGGNILEGVVRFLDDFSLKKFEEEFMKV